MRVGVDLDGVCYDFGAAFWRWLNWSYPDEFGGKEYQPPTRWEFYEDWGLTLDEFLSECHTAAEAGHLFRHGQPFSGTQEAFAFLKAAGHSIHIVTDRSFGVSGASQRNTVTWLEQNGLEYDSLTFSPDKTIAAIDVMIDDKPENCAALRDVGVGVFLRKQAWNRHVWPEYRTVLDLLHFAELIA